MKAISTSIRAHGLPKRQSGVALIVGLLILLVLIIVGVAASNLATQQERMARGSRDYNVALQAAEAGLRDAERDPRILNVEQFAAGCTQGLCRPAPVGSTPVWEESGVLGGGSADTSAQYGAHTGASPFPRSPLNAEASPTPSVAATGGVALQPRYVVEALINPTCAGLPPGDCEPQYIYRITSRGYGSDQRTQVTLQEVYNP
jgi:type IV pilus assembly protein PilX